jgi:NTE family protein
MPPQSKTQHPLSPEKAMKPFRRDLLAMAVAGAALPSAGSAQTACSDTEALSTQISQKLFGGDGLARPVPDTAIKSDLATGLDRTLVLGGGGEYYVAWYCGFFHGLMEQGVDPASQSELVLGTSAGAYIGSSMTSGHFQRLRTEFEFFGHFPSLFAKLAPISSENASQKRAQEINFSVKDGGQATIRAIGHAALAADNSVNGPAVERVAWLLTGDSKTSWPPAKMFTSTNDCFTGERLIIHKSVADQNRIPLAHAAAASSSLPGVIGPTLLGQRYCMDGGISKTWAHTDVVAGSKRSLVITLTNGYEGSLLSGIPHNIHREIDALEAAGTKAMLIIAGTPPGVNLLDPNQISPALYAGYERAKKEAPKIREFFS